MGGLSMIQLVEVPEVMTVEEVARELRVSKSHVHNLINGTILGAPRLPSIRLGRRHLVRRATFREWLERSENHNGGGILRYRRKLMP